MGSLDEWLQERDFMIDELHVNLLRAQQKMKNYADKKRRAKRRFEKLAARYYGPFAAVVQRVGKVAYNFALPPDCQLKPVFYVVQSKKCVGNHPTTPTIPQQLTPELELIAEPEEVLEVRKKKQGREAVTEVLIKRKNLPLFEATWEEATMVHDHFPSLHLEDKVRLLGGGDAIDESILYIYISCPMVIFVLI